jgi:hypothetical protein
MKKEQNKEIKDKQEEKKIFMALEALSVSEGGQILIQNFKRDILANIETISLRYSTLSHIELISLCAKLKIQIDTLRSLTRAKKNKEFITEEIEELVSNALEE